MYGKTEEEQKEEEEEIVGYIYCLWKPSILSGLSTTIPTHHSLRPLHTQPASQPAIQQPALTMHHLPLPLLLSLLSLLLPPIHTLPVPLPLPIPPNIPTLSTALNALSTLTIRPQGSSTGYDRDQFPHWETQPGSACNTRELVLARDGVNVVQDPASCAATSGIWRSPFDGATWRAPGDVDVDHLVPLSNAWRSGASDWSLARRRAFANDLVNPELIVRSSIFLLFLFSCFFSPRVCVDKMCVDDTGRHRQRQSRKRIFRSRRLATTTKSVPLPSPLSYSHHQKKLKPRRKIIKSFLPLHLRPYVDLCQIPIRSIRHSRRIRCLTRDVGYLLKNLPKEIS